MNIEIAAKIKQALNLAQMEIRAMYKQTGKKGSNILDIVDEAYDLCSEPSLLTEQATGMKWKKAIEDLPIRNVRVTARWNKTDDGYEGGWHRASRDWLDATLKTHPDVEWLDESPMQSKEGDDDRNKTDFEIFQDMIDSGEDIRMSPHFISADLIKQGGKVCMGVESKEIHDLMTGEFTCALYIVNSKQFFDRKNKNHDKLH